MPHTPPGSPKPERKTEEEKNLGSSQESSEEHLEEGSQHSQEDASQHSEENGYSEDENAEQQAPASEEAPQEQQNSQPRNGPTLFGFNPRVQRTVLFVCPHGHLHQVPEEMLIILSLAQMLNDIGALDDENELEENVGQEAQTEAKQEESVDQNKVNHSEDSDEESEEEDNVSGRCYQM